MDDASVERTILENIEASIGGLFTHRLRRQLADACSHKHLYGLTEGLLAAQRDRLIDFRQRRWNHPQQVEEETLEGLSEIFCGDSNKPVVKSIKAIPGIVLSGSMESDRRAFDDSDTITKDDPWQLFKTLCGHYVECLRLGGASRASCWADKHSKQFHILDLRARWWPDVMGAKSIRISRSDLGPDFLSGLAKRGHEPVLLGYPLSVVSLPEDGELVTPMSILQCDFILDESGMTLTPTSAVPVLNPDWVGKRALRRDFRKALRQLADLTDRDDDEITFVGREGWSDVSEMSRMTSAYLSNHIADTLDPARIKTVLHLDRTEVLQNCIGLFLISENPYTKGCQADIRTLESEPNENLQQTALSAFFAHDIEDIGSVPIASPFELSEDQYLAVRDGLSSKITLISGPPGTGKSQVVAGLLLSAAMSGKTALFSSHTHKAIDAVQTRVDKLAPGRAVLMRAGGDSVDGRFDFKAAVNALIARLRDGADTTTHRRTMEAVNLINTEVDDILFGADELSRLTSTLGMYSEEKYRRLHRRKNEGEEIQFDIISNPSWLRRMYAMVSKLFSNPFRKRAKFERDVLELREVHLSDAELDREILKSETLHKGKLKELERLKEKASLADLLSKLNQLSESALPEFLESLDQTTPEHRQRLTELLGAVGLARTRDEKLKIWRDYADAIIGHFPLWSATALSVPAQIPLVPTLFDYVIIDEATTCNIAQAIPLLARARQAIIVGDKMQTEMISDLDPSREREMLIDAGLGDNTHAKFSFSQVSLFDLASSLPGTKRHILRDHFRCHPDMAGFVSESFYEGRLFVRTNQSALRVPSGSKAGLHWTDVVGPVESAGKGCKSETEAIAIAEHVVELIRVREYKGSIGVVTPFQKQAQLIIRGIEQRLSYDEIQNNNLVVGTAHQFQGDDRDLVLVSLCYARSMPRGGEWFLRNSTGWLNVAISRARAVCHIFGDRSACEQSSIRHISRLARRLKESNSDVLTSEPQFESPWERYLYEALVRAGLKPVTQYPLAGRRLDMAMFNGDIKLDIEVDGDTYHRDRDGFRKVSDIWRDHVVMSLGWKVRRFWVYELRENMESCVERVRRDIEDE